MRTTFTHTNKKIVICIPNLSGAREPAHLQSDQVFFLFLLNFKRSNESFRN